MKIKILILIAVSAIITLSFTFASVKEQSITPNSQDTIKTSDAEPIGGFVSDGK